MRSAFGSLGFTFLGFVAGAIFFIAMSTVLAWTGPTQTAPNGNVSAPVNVGTTYQIKNGALGINALAVFGNSILQAASYLNWGPTSGSAGYGIRDNAGTMEFKNSGGSWMSATSTIQDFFASDASYSIGQVKFSDGTIQTKAPILSCTTRYAIGAVAFCQPGETLTGGGIDCRFGGQIQESYPFATGTGWSGRCKDGIFGTVYAQCCTL